MALAAPAVLPLTMLSGPALMREFDRPGDVAANDADAAGDNAVKVAPNGPHLLDDSAGCENHTGHEAGDCPVTHGDALLKRPGL